MRTITFAAALAVCMPVVAAAQGKRAAASSSPDGASTAEAVGAPSARTPSSYDLADLNPATYLIKNKKKAALADSTVKQLKAVEKKLKERNAPFYTTYDSTRKWTIPLTSSASSAQSYGLRGGQADSKLAANTVSPAEQAKMQSSMRDLRVLLAQFRERHKTDVEEVLAVIPEAQQKAAQDVVGQLDSDVQKAASGVRP